MNTKSPSLFVEISRKKFVFSVCINHGGQDFRLIEKITINHNVINNNKFVDISKAQEEIKINIQELENKTNYTFQDVIIILDCFKYSCINISASKKLNSSQVMKENISYILNMLKLTVTENEKEKNILHIFNSKSVLDGVEVKNLPIGLFGNFYNHELTFFLIENNDFKNLQQIFSKNNLNIKKIFLKEFIVGAELIEQKRNVETFFVIKITKDNSSITFFDQASFKYIDNFNFGSNIILQDIKKVCSMDISIVEKVISERLYKYDDLKNDELLEEKYFPEGKYRKIRKKLILEIVNSRIEEIIKIIFNKNINLNSFKKDDSKIYLDISDELISNSLNDNFQFFLSKNNNYQINLFKDFLPEIFVARAAHLSSFGWKKEALPIIQTKNSLITKIFKSIFG